MSSIEEKSLQHWRRELLQEASGRVLEVGAGTGANLPYYPDDVEEIWLSEPDAVMREQLVKRVEALEAEKQARIRITDHLVDELTDEEGEFDTVVLTLVLCSVPDVNQALQAIKQRLKPGGKLLFLEHVVAPQKLLRRVQHLVEPVWKLCAGNCHLTRDALRFLKEAGFEVQTLQEEALKGALPIVKPAVRGVAIQS